MIPCAEPVVWNQLKQLGLTGTRREQNGRPFLSDENNHILDLDTSHIRNIEDLNRALLNIAGIVETGYFLDTASVIIIAKGDQVTVVES